MNATYPTTDIYPRTPVRGLKSPVPRHLLRAVEQRTSHIQVKMAETSEEYDGICRLNYQTYVEELGQDVGDDSGRLADHHYQNSVYLVAKDEATETVIGMAAMTRPGHPFSIETALAHAEIVDLLRQQACEFRRLCVVPQYRHQGLYIRLAEGLAQYCIDEGIPYVFISAIEANVNMYKKVGFTTFDRPFCKGQAQYYPMLGAMPNADPRPIQAWLSKTW